MQEGLWQHFTQPLATWFCFIFVFCWQALKGVLIRGLLILLRRSIQPAAEERVASPAVAYGSCGPRAASAGLLWLTHSAVKPSAQLLLCLPTAFLESSSVPSCQLVVLYARRVTPLVFWVVKLCEVVTLYAFQSYVVGPSYFKDCFLELQPEECLPSDVTPLIFPPQYWLWAEVVRCLPPGPCPRPSVISLVHLQSFGQSGIFPEGPQQLELPLSLQFLPSPLLWSWLTADPVQATIQTPTCRLNHRKSKSFLQSYLSKLAFQSTRPVLLPAEKCVGGSKKPGQGGMIGTGLAPTQFSYLLSIVKMQLFPSTVIAHISKQESLLIALSHVWTHERARQKPEIWLSTTVRESGEGVS